MQPGAKRRATPGTRPKTNSPPGKGERPCSARVPTKAGGNSNELLRVPDRRSVRL
jgi:hypothetical protein